jgi:hypothetical protein
MNTFVLCLIIFMRHNFISNTQPMHAGRGLRRGAQVDRCPPRRAEIASGWAPSWIGLPQCWRGRHLWQGQERQRWLTAPGILQELGLELLPIGGFLSDGPQHLQVGKCKNEDVDFLAS